MMKICTDSIAMIGHANAELQGNKSDWIVKLVDSRYPQLHKNVPPKFLMLSGDHVTKVKYKSTSHELQVRRYYLYEFISQRETRVTSYCLLNELRVTFFIQVTSYSLFHELRVTFYIRDASYCVIRWVTSSFYCTSYQLLFVYELQITVFYTSYAFQKFVCYSYVWSFWTWKMF